MGKERWERRAPNLLLLHDPFNIIVASIIGGHHAIVSVLITSLPLKVTDKDQFPVKDLIENKRISFTKPGTGTRV